MLSYFFQILLASLVAHSVVVGGSLGNAISVFSISLAYSCFLYLNSKLEPEANQDLKNKINSLEEKIQRVENKVGASVLAHQFQVKK